MRYGAALSSLAMSVPQFWWSRDVRYRVFSRPQLLHTLRDVSSTPSRCKTSVFFKCRSHFLFHFLVFMLYQMFSFTLSCTFYCRHRRRLHSARGQWDTCPLLLQMNGHGGTVSRTANEKLTKMYWPSRKRLIVLTEPKKVEGHDKSFCVLHFQIRSGATNCRPTVVIVKQLTVMMMKWKFID